MFYEFFKLIKNYATILKNESTEMKKIFHFIIIIMLALNCIAKPKQVYYYFDKVTGSDEFTQNIIYALIQDKKGFMWIGTKDGLHRYDGYKFINYTHDPKNPNSISDNWIHTLYEDESGILWIGTLGGLNKFDPNTNTFISYRNDPDNPNSISDNRIRTIYKDPDETVDILWIGTEDGLNKFDRRNGRFIYYRNDPLKPNSLSHNLVYAIHRDSNGILWIGTRNGLNRFNQEKEIFTQYRQNPNNSNTLSSNYIYVIYEDPDEMGNILWIGTRGGGLNKFNIKKEVFTRYNSNLQNINDTVNYNVKSICEDEYGKLWIATNNGLQLFNRKTEEFRYIMYNPDDPNGISSDNIFSIYRDLSSNIWIGTNNGINIFCWSKQNFKCYKPNLFSSNNRQDNDVEVIFRDKYDILWMGTKAGLSKCDMEMEHVTHYRYIPNHPKSLNSNSITAIYEDESGILWIGTTRGLNRYDREKDEFTLYRHEPDNSEILSNSNISTICSDRGSTLWLGTWGRGINKFNYKTRESINYRKESGNPYSLGNDMIRILFKDVYGNIWIGTFQEGLNKFNREKEIFIQYKHDPNIPNSLSDNRIMTIYEDLSNTLWIGTRGGGLNRFNKEKETFTSYTTKNGLPTNRIVSILEDDSSNLWLGTRQGLSKFNVRTETFTNYDEEDGLMNRAFNDGSCWKTKNGKMLFGGANGCTIFHPDSIKNSKFKPPIVLTECKIYNKEIKCEKDISRLDQINLTYKQNFISFEFASLDYSVPGKNQYAYMMEGLDKDWIYCGTRRHASYTNLHPGKYIYKVIGSNSDGIWNKEGISIKLNITPPFWNTPWFYLLCICTGIGFILSLIYIRTNNIENQRKELEKVVNIRTNELQKSLKEKEILLKEIHHRVKNNLQVICSLLNLQVKNIDNPKAIDVFMESRNRVRSMAIIHENLYQTSNFVKVDFNNYIHNLVHELSHSYGIDPTIIELQIDVRDVSLGIDYAVPCGLILNELISNAIKHAFPSKRKTKAKIKIFLRELKKNVIEMVVQDNGVGISKDIDIGKTDSLGLRLVDILAEKQLDGKIYVDRTRGTKIQIKFKIKLD
jgi:two-component sensor histidine kinase/ligand-binding sensor domain-containing protein